MSCPRTLAEAWESGTADCSNPTTFRPAGPPAIWIYATAAAWGLDQCNKLPSELPKIAGDEYRVVLEFDQESIRQLMGQGWRAERNNLSWTIGNHAVLTLQLDAGADQRQLGLAFSSLVISNHAIGQPD